MLHGLFSWPRRVCRSCLETIRQRPRRSLLIAAIGALVVMVASPFLWASYHWFAGKADLRHFRNAEARRHLNACLKVWPWSRSVEVHLLAARAARRETDYAESLRLLQVVQSTLDDHSPDMLLEWALLHAVGGDLTKVEKHLRDAASAEDPEQMPLILEALTVGYLRWSRLAQALQCVDAWLARDPDNVEALYLRSSVYRQSGAWTKVAPDLRRVVELEPNRPWARWWLAVALVNIGRYDEALSNLEVLRQQPPEHLDQTDVLARLAICRHQMGRSREARELLDEVLAERPNHGLALLTRGQIDKDNGQLPKAEKWLRRAAEALPYDYRTHWALTECLRQEGKTEEAQAAEAYANRLKDRWERFTEISSHQLSQRPNDPALYCELGKLLLELGNPEGAKNWFYSALLVDPQCAAAMNALADYFTKQGDLATAEDFRRQAQESMSQQSQARNAQMR